MNDERGDGLVVPNYMICNQNMKESVPTDLLKIQYPSMEVVPERSDEHSIAVRIDEQTAKAISREHPELILEKSLPYNHCDGSLPELAADLP